MKKILFFVFVIFTINVNGQLKVTTVGNIGIGNNTPTYKLDVQGKIRYGYWGLSSTWEQIILDWNNQWGAPEFYCNSDCNFNIGKSTNRVNRLYVYGVHANAYWGPASDERLKENIKKNEYPLSKVLQLNAISFNYKSDVRNGSKITNSDDGKTTFGYIAQDLIKIFPELVLEPDSTISYYSVNYVGLVPVFNRGIKGATKYYNCAKPFD